MTPSTEPLYLGVDAGNSKTVAVLADRSGTVLGYGIARFLAWSTPGHVDPNGDSDV